MLVFGAAFFRIAASRETNSGSCNHSLGTDRAKVNAIFNPQKKFLGSGKFFSRTFAARCDDFSLEMLNAIERQPAAMRIPDEVRR